MGILNFHKYMKEKYGDAFQHKWLDFYDHVYIDMNYSLHYCNYNIKNEKQLFDKLFLFFDRTLHQAIPIKSLTTCIDGVAPLSKLLLQRKRRKNIASNTKPDNFDSLLFSSGTQFMKSVGNKIKDYTKFVQYAYNIDVTYLDEHKDEIIDEAELKLKYAIDCNIENNPNDTNIIVTNDADVIVMLSTCKKLDNIYVFYYTSGTSEIVSMKKLLDMHTDKVGKSLNYGLDFSFLNIMMGNDYFPKLGLVTFEKMFEVYTEVLKVSNDSLINEELSINFNFFKSMLIKIIDKTKSKAYQTVTLDTFRKNVYKNYLDGLLWCLDTYKNGKCVRYNYTYNHLNPPHPLGIIMEIDMERHELSLNKETSKPLQSHLYLMLVLPSNAKHLIDTKYHDFFEEINKHEGKCDICNNFQKEINNNDEKNKLYEIKKQYTQHKKSHEWTLDNIEMISQKFINLYQ